MSKSHEIDCWKCGEQSTLKTRFEFDGCCWACGEEIDLEDHLARAMDERDQLRAEVEALQAFANEIVSGGLDGGSFDGCEIQEVATKHGLLRMETRDEACGDGCACSEYGFPIECYRRTALLGAMAAKEVNP